MCVCVCVCVCMDYCIYGILYMWNITPWNGVIPYKYHMVSLIWDFPGGSAIKNLPANAGDSGLIPGSGRSPAVGNDNPLWYSCLKNSMDRGAL